MWTTSTLSRRILVIAFVLVVIGEAFVPPKFARTTIVMRPTSQLSVERNGGGGTENKAQRSSTEPLPSSSKGRKSRGPPAKKTRVTIGDLAKELLKNPAYLEGDGSSPSPGRQSKSRRTRRRAESPQQRYMYAAQRVKFQKEGKPASKSSTLSSSSSTVDEDDRATAVVNPMLIEARRLGLTNPANHHCDPLVDTVMPEIVGKIRVDGISVKQDDSNGNGSTSIKGSDFAYLIHKPAGWSIMGGKNKSNKKGKPTTDGTSSTTGPLNESKNKKRSSTRRVKIIGDKGKEEYLEFDEADVYALLTPKERAEIEKNGGTIFEAYGPAYDESISIPGWYDVARMTPEDRQEAGIGEEDYDPGDIPSFDEADILALLSPEERQEYESDKHGDDESQQRQPQLQQLRSSDDESLDGSVRENLKRIEARSVSKAKGTACFSAFQRPSVVAWLKETKAAEGNPIRGGNYWTAIAGAVDVDDSGLMLLCPKTCCENVFVEYAEYVAVIGTGNYLAPRGKARSEMKEIPEDAIQMEVVSRVRKGREGDISQTARFVVSEHLSTCSSIVQAAQTQIDDGIRGDPAANPLDRRAPRRLIHCTSMAVSSLLFDETIEAKTDLPDDIKILSDRLNNHKYKNGSFLGRQSLRDNPLTNAYREVNGLADGFPGWTVDRYCEWLFVQHDEKEHRGPLPSIHDGHTAGVYILPANADRGAMGSRDIVRPRLLEGRPAPEILSILENGITYHVSLDRDLSTGIFLDQRPQRAWLSRHCNSDTHVLNCFAHCGAFSIAAATAGAQSVSLDLNKKWLDRIQPQLEANGIPFDERHDCIYGDVFEWLEKLAKRGEKYDIVILDPPSSSIGKKKRRWSAKNDFDELVQMAAPLVKKGGLLWTTTNSASISPLKFASMCEKGLEAAGASAKLERIQPTPVDFPSVGPQTIKNFSWRIN